ncbi:endonuclease/exonuclease/phosphatase family protein [Skermanella mucosa]|uniref:endonuclease/exonuclease/phosphatase family protein n=1 Tax=Skermanella mucosa TaxID=1789672 RepID=UPI00192CB48D|nr:endonuclease/exonuclease/phosphatase family protein [Skermanella mucosa]UEM19785.1 endonuclease/exonuclease/phosphatase family protein [Skermanella mucosa]
MTETAAWCVAGGALGVTAASLLGRADWRLSLLSHFRLHLTAGCLLALPIARAADTRGQSAVIAAALAMNLADILHHELSRSGAEARSDGNRGGPGTTIVSFNALRHNPDKEKALDWLALCDADVLVILEVSSDWRKALLGRLDHTYPYRALGPDSQGDQIMILSRHPLRRLASHDQDDQGLLMVHVAHPGLPFTLIGVHPDHAIERRGLRPQRALLELLAEAIRNTQGPVAVAGDFNTTPWSSEFRRFLEASGLDVPLLRRGTFPSRLGWAGLPIDHVLAGQGVRLRKIAPGPDVGSDHRPVVARLEHG